MTEKEHPEDVNRSEEELNEEEPLTGPEVDETDLIADLEKSRNEAEQYLDSLQRLKAEFENFRKRMMREQSEFLKFAAQGLITELLPVLDNFGRALDHEIHGGQLDEYKQGLRLVYGQLLDVLAKEGLSTLEPVGEAFDPTLHEALMQEESEEYPEGTVIQVLEKGYALKDRVIRPAKVIVAK